MTEIERDKNYLMSPFLSYDRCKEAENNPVEAIAEDVAEQTEILLCKFFKVYPNVSQHKIINRVCEMLGELKYD